MFRTATLSIFAITFRIFFGFFCCVAMSPLIAKGQVLIDGGYYFGDLGPDDIVIPIQEGDAFVESASIEDIIEGVGTVAHSSVPIYSLPRKNSTVIRYAIPGDKVFIIMSSGDWYSVKLHTGQDGFIEKKHLNTVKVFYDESVTTNNMDKRLNYELRELVNRFNKALSESIYLEKYSIAPRLTVTTTSKRGNKMVITLEYSAVDRNGSIIPSKQDNVLQEEMKKFIELLFMKMLPSKATSYKIVIKRPIFSNNGQVLNMQGSYAELEVDYDVIEKNYSPSEGRIFHLLECDIDGNELFSFFPS